MIACTKCQRQNEDHYKFCLGCGSPLAAQAPVAAPAEESTACPQCASRILAGQRFCGSCGFRAPKDDEIAPATEAPAQVAAAISTEAVEARTEHGQTIDDEAPEPEPTPELVAPVIEEAPQEAAPEPEPTPEPEPVVAAAVAAAPVLGRIIMVNPDGSPGESYDLKEGDNEIGRLTGAAVFQRDPFLSPKHAVFRVREGGIEIEDLNSLNGVFYRTTGPVEISPGDTLRLGQEVLRFESLKDIPLKADLDQPGVGSPADNVWGRVARISGPENAASNAFLLWKDEHTIGRERGDFTFPDDGFVSGLHARIFRQDGRVYVEDLKSSNGTYLKIKQKHLVAAGSLLLLGKQPFRVVLAG